MNAELQAFLDRASEILKRDERILGLCVGGSWITNELDEYSDLDLVLVTSTDLSAKEEMLGTAQRLGSLVAGFTGEHVGERRLLICLYENPVLHVDLKFVRLDQLGCRVEDPVVLWERDHAVTALLASTVARWPQPDFQWIEDRFWVWIHYAATKLGRGEDLEAIDFISYLRAQVLGPLYHLKYGSLPRGSRKLEFILDPEDLASAKATVPVCSFASIVSAVYEVIEAYRKLRDLLYGHDVRRRSDAERCSVHYLDGIARRD